MQVTGTIEQIELHVIPSKLAGVQGRPVSRVSLAIERAVDDRGAPVPEHNLIGPFQGPPDLPDRFSPGQRVQIVTTEALSMHIETIELFD